MTSVSIETEGVAATMRSCRVSTDLAKNWPDLNEISPCRSSMDFVEIAPNLCLREKGRVMNGKLKGGGGRQVRLVGVGFSCEDPPIDSSISVPGSGDPPSNIAGVGSNGLG